MKRDLSIITINFNTAELVVDMVKSFEKDLVGVNYEIIVIDNCSQDGSFAKLKNIFKNNKYVTLIKNKRNLGFGKANNQGLAKATGKYVLFLNSDTLSDNINFKEMLDWLDKNKKIGAMTCKLKNKDGSVQGTGGFFPTLTRLLLWILYIDDIPFVDKIVKPFHPHHSRSPLRNNKFYEKPKELDWITGAFFLARRDALGGGFDPDFFMYGEDVDLSKRIKEKGYKIFYNPAWNIIHLGGKSSNSSYPIISEFEGLKTYYIKHNKSRVSLLRILLKLGIKFRIMVSKFLGNKSLVQAYEESLGKI